MKAHQTRKSCWRDQFAASEVIQRVRPRESFEYLHNPHRGTATFQRFNGDPVSMDWKWNDREGPFTFKPFRGDPESLVNQKYPRTSLSYCRWIWADIEPRKGHFRWDVIDGALAAARAHGQTLQLRLQPFIGDDMPAWYWAAGGTADPAEATRRAPDHNAPAYLEHWGDTIRAFGARYDGHPDLESFDVAYGGPCGEMGGNATPETAKQLVDVYLDSFRKTQLLSMLGTHGCKYGAALKERRLGWRGDCYGDMRADGKGHVPDHLCWNHMYDEYPQKTAEDGVTDVWRTAPVTFESCWSVPFWHEKKWDIDWILEHGLKYHVSVFMPKSCFYPDEWREKLDAFDRRLGYRFVLRQMMLPIEAKPGEPIQVNVWIDNVGVAPIYRPYRLALRFRQRNAEEIVELQTDVRTWMPEYTWFSEKIVFPPMFKPGEVKVDAGIIDWVTRRPRVRLAIDGPTDDGWHLLTSMDAVK